MTQDETREAERLLADHASMAPRGSLHWNTRAVACIHALLARVQELEAELATDRQTSLDDPAEQRAERYAAEAAALTLRAQELESKLHDQAWRLKDADAIILRLQRDLSIAQQWASLPASALALIEQWRERIEHLKNFHPTVIAQRKEEVLDLSAMVAVSLVLDYLAALLGAEPQKNDALTPAE